MNTFGEDLVRLIEAHGITHAFGIPGVHLKANEKDAEATTRYSTCPLRDGNRFRGTIV